MFKLVRSLLSFILVLQLIIPYSTFAAAVGEFTSVIGNVTQTRASETIKPAEKSPVELKDLIATALTSSATMVFSDESTITLSENTQLEIKEFLFKDQTRRGVFSMPIGKLRASVKKYIGGKNVFEILSPTVGVGVRGTGFEFVEETKEAATAKEQQRKAIVSCTEGSLDLSAFSDTGAVVSTAVLEAGQMAVIIGGVITISAIAAIAGGTIAGSAEAGTAGGAAATGAAASTGLSTAAIAGIALGGAAVVGGAVAMGGGGGDDTSTPSNTCSTSTDGKWSGTFSGTGCSGPESGTWIQNCSRCYCSMTITNSRGKNYSGNVTISGNSVSGSGNGTGCDSTTQCTINVTGTISGNSVSGSASGCGFSGTWSGTKTGSVTVNW